MSDRDVRLLTLHGLRLTGLATVGGVAEVHDLDPVTVERELERLCADGHVASARGDDDRWTLTSEGRRHGEELLARELAETSADAGTSGSSAVNDVYERFLDLNRRFLDVCTRWQVVSREPIVLNDHTDPDYDASVISAVEDIHDLAQPMCAELEAVLDRFGRYRSGFTEALNRLRRGETEWLTKPTILSYHTLWFQLHEDLLATLGLERAAEAARLHSGSTIEESTFEHPQGSPVVSPGTDRNRRSQRPDPGPTGQSRAQTHR